MKKHKKTYLRNIVIIPTLLAVAVLSFLSGIISFNIQESEAEKQLLEQSRILKLQMDAVWDFIDTNQDNINTDADGTYNFKGLQCSIAGTSVGKLFSARSDYTIRYVSSNPRNETNFADPVEQSALSAFSEENAVTEYYEISDYKEKRTFRYIAPIFAEKSCLSCHGEPIGEIDESGYPKEGAKEGDILGAISITSPVINQENAQFQNTVREIITVFLLLAACALIISLIVSKRITVPLQKFEKTVHEIGDGNLDSQVDAKVIGATGEIKGLVKYFNETLVKLQGLYENLESQVELRTEQLTHINAELLESRNQLEETNALLQKESTYKSEFVSSMSHELRTPLTSIIAFAEVLQNDEDTSEAKRSEIIDEILVNSEILLHLINDILDTAKLDAGKMILRPAMVDIVDIVGMLDSMISPLAEKMKINYTSTVDPDVPLFFADEEYLRIIIKNLVENAIKYTPQDGQVKLHASCDEDDNTIIVSVSDTGVGIAKEDINIIFDMFTQGNNMTPKNVSSGKGLGLAIARNLANLHNGTIVVDSVENVGSTFKLILPIQEESN